MIHYITAPYLSKAGIIYFLRIAEQWEHEQPITGLRELI